MTCADPPRPGSPGRAAAELARFVRSGDRVLVGSGAGEPAELLAGLLELATDPALSIEVVQVLIGSRGDVLGAVDHGNRVLLPVPARGSTRPGVDVLPTSMFQLARAIADGSFPVDGVLFSGRSCGGGQVSAGICLDVVPAAFRTARFRAVELNAALPQVAGDVLPLGRCEVVVDSVREPPTLASLAPSPVALAIGEHVAELVDDGAVLEVGIGRSLAGVATALAGRGHELSVHSGLVSDWTSELVEAGVAVRPLPCVGGVPVTASAAMGSSRFYAWLDGCSTVRLVDSLHAQDPAHLAGLGGFVAVNAATRVDLFGQVGAPAEAGPRRAVGGLLDFAVAGAYGGRSVVALESVDGNGRSQIVPTLTALQLPSQLVTHVVTEHGIARLENRTWAARAREVVAVAHPDHRELLRRSLAEWA